MQLSIRNQLDATVSSVAVGPAMTTVHARLDGGQDMTAVVTSAAATDLKLRPGQPVRMLVKSTEVSLSLEPIKQVSIRNLLPGRVVAVDHGEVMSTVKIEMTGGGVLTAAITKESAEGLGLSDGASVTAMVKSTDVAVAVP